LSKFCLLSINFANLYAVFIHFAAYDPACGVQQEYHEDPEEPGPGIQAAYCRTILRKKAIQQGTAIV
jgi:hypothetical protein